MRRVQTGNGCSRPSISFGPNLRAYVIYLLIELRLSLKNIGDHLKTVFGLVVNVSSIYDIKSFVANEYEPLYRSLLQSISSGGLVHADETKGAVYGGGHYIWIFTNLTTVAYVYSPTRNADVLQEVLQGFSGVLVSDFYSAYDSLGCAQQKCLIHLMRDINELVLKESIQCRVGNYRESLWSVIEEYSRQHRSMGVEGSSTSKTQAARGQVPFRD